MQVEGPKGLKLLGNKLAAQGPLVLWHGSLAAATATAVGHFPWFYTFNLLQATRAIFFPTYPFQGGQSATGDVSYCL